MNEKTLELNISAEILYDRRTVNPNCYIKAPSSRREYEFGYDVSLSNLGEHYLIFYQFKAPKPKKGNEYFFTINRNKNNNQHETLLRLAGKYNYVQYAFPLIIDITELESYNGNLRYRTAFIPVQNIQIANDKKPHKVKINVNFLTTNDMRYIEINSNLKNVFLYKDLIKEMESKLIGIKIIEYLKHIKKIQIAMSIEQKKELFNVLRTGIFFIF